MPDCGDSTGPGGLEPGEMALLRTDSRRIRDHFQNILNRVAVLHRLSCAMSLKMSDFLERECL
jgi:hypothetical protein